MPKYLQMGVSAPLKNGSFAKGTPFNTTLYTDITSTLVTAGISSLDVTSVVPTLLVTLGKGDKIKIGPSTATANPGATEEKVIDEGCISDDGSSATLELTSNLLFEYAEGDPVSGLGEYFPDGWTAPTYTNYNDEIKGTIYMHPKLNGINLPQSSRDTSDLRDFTTYGVDDYFCFKSYLNNASSLTGHSNYNMLRYDFTDGDLLESTYYRVGLFYRYKLTDYSSTSGAETKDYIITHDGTTTLASKVFLSINQNIEQDYWKQYVGDPTQTASSLSGTPYILFEKYTPYSTSFKLYQNIDFVYFEHAKGTDDASSAVYTFTELPAFGSTTWGTNTFEKTNKLASGNVKYGQINNRKNIQYTYNCRFENVSGTFLKNLMVLEMWQRLGYDLILHTGEDFGSTPFRLPPILKGHMKLSGISKSSWETSRTSFNFNFMEVE